MAQTSRIVSLYGRPHFFQKRITCGQFSRRGFARGPGASEMSTKVNQYVNVTNGNVTVQTVVIVP